MGCANHPGEASLVRSPLRTIQVRGGRGTTHLALLQIRLPHLARQCRHDLVERDAERVQRNLGMWYTHFLS